MSVQKVAKSDPEYWGEIMYFSIPFKNMMHLCLKAHGKESLKTLLRGLKCQD